MGQPTISFRRRIALLIGVFVLGGVLLYLSTKKQDDGFRSDQSQTEPVGSGRRPRGVSDGREISTRDIRNKVVNEDDERVAQCVAFLRDLERRRVSVGDPVEIDLVEGSPGYEVELKFRALTAGELSEASRLLQELKGHRRGKFGTVPWSSYLRSQFGLDWEGCEIKGFVYYNQSNNGVNCMISRTNPENGEDEVRVVDSYIVGGKEKGKWRFSHLVDFDERTDEPASE